MNQQQVRRGQGRLPEAMQGRWVDVDDPGGLLVFDGFDVTYGGRAVRHDYFTALHVDGALCVNLGIDATDDEAKDSFARENVTNLVFDPEGGFHAYSLNFASEFERVEA